MRDNAPVDEITWKRRTAVPLMIASLAYLVAYSWRVIADLTGPARGVASLIVVVTWAMFIIDYVVRLLMAPRRAAWFRSNLSALAFALVPVLRLVRLLRFATRIPGLHSTRGDRLRTDIMVYGAGAAVILMYVSSLAVLEFERHAPDATITTFGDAFWWACVTVTTTGFGDYTPVTAGGRVVGVGLMFGGVALAGIITATLASLVVELASRGHDDREPATRAQMRELMARLDVLTAAAGAGGDAASHGPHRHAPAPAPADGHAPADVDVLDDAEADPIDDASADDSVDGPDAGAGVGSGGDDRPGG